MTSIASPVVTWFISVVIAHDLAKEQRRNFGDDITSAIRTAKKKVNLVINFNGIIFS